MAACPNFLPPGNPSDAADAKATIVVCHAPGDRVVAHALVTHLKRVLDRNLFECTLSAPVTMTPSANARGSTSCILLLVATQRALGDPPLGQQIDAALREGPDFVRRVVVAQMQRCEASRRWPALAAAPVVDFVTTPYSDACARLTDTLRQAAAEPLPASPAPRPAAWSEQPTTAEIGASSRASSRDGTRESVLAAAREGRWADVVRDAEWLEAELAQPSQETDRVEDAVLWRALSQAYSAMGRATNALVAIDRARELTPFDDLDTRMDLLVDRLTVRQHEWHLTLLRAMDVALEERPESVDQQSERLGHLVELQRQEDALALAREITAQPEASLNHWLARARLARVVLVGDEAEREVAQALDVVEALAPDDFSVVLACRDLRRSPAPLDGLPERLAALGYVLQRRDGVERDGVERDGVEVVLPPLCDIPAGTFLMGSDLTHDPAAFADELPQHRVALGSYHIMRFPVTVAEYLRFVLAGQRPPLNWRGQLVGLDRPVTSVPWSAAAAYASWLSRLTGQRWRLPSEAEWEKAARWDDLAQHARIFPWGDTFDPTRANTAAALVEALLPVGTLPQGTSPLGMEDAAGNIWEWTSSRYQAYPYRGDDGREALRQAGSHIVRGGSRALDPRFARTACRGFRSAIDFGPQIGFRLICEGDV